MKQLSNRLDYISPKAETIDILIESILCQSGEPQTGFGVSLEGMTENEYTFTF